AKFSICRASHSLLIQRATTFNSSQGLILRRTVVDLRTDEFAHGQLYTALSRVRNQCDVRTLWSPTNEERETTNVVYSSLLE
ncbi:uncharacterized protein BJ212DRAFT_1224568, partial [Suillus subaureus]